MPNGAFDRGDQEPGGVGFTHTAEGAGVLCLARDLWIFVKRSDDDGNLRSTPHNFTGRFEAVATRHNDVHDYDVRMQSFNLSTASSPSEASPQTSKPFSASRRCRKRPLTTS